MKKAFTFFTAGQESRMMLEIDGSVLGSLVIQLAANLIAQIPDYPTEDGEKPTRGVGRIIHLRFNWASHGSSNAMLKQAMLIYEVAECLSKQPNHPIWICFGLERRAAIQIITDALSKVQDWKEAVCKDIHAKHGEEFGSDTGFQKMNWTTHNEKLLEMVVGVNA